MHTKILLNIIFDNVRNLLDIKQILFIFLLILTRFLLLHLFWLKVPVTWKLD